MKYRYRNAVDLSGLYPKNVKAFQYGIDETPKWFVKMSKKNKYETYVSGDGVEFIGYTDYYTGKFMEVAHTGLYIIKSKGLIRILEPEEFKERYGII